MTIMVLGRTICLLSSLNTTAITILVYVLLLLRHFMANCKSFSYWLEAVFGSDKVRDTTERVELIKKRMRDAQSW